MASVLEEEQSADGTKQDVDARSQKPGRAEIPNSAKTLCPGIIVGNQKSMKRALLSTQSMQRDLHTAACHLWAQKGHHQCESASSTCLAHVLWVVPRLAWPNHLRDWNEHHQSGMQDLALKKSLFLRALVKLSNYSCNLKRGEKEVAPAPNKAAGMLKFKNFEQLSHPHSFTAPCWAFPTNAGHGKTSQRYTWDEYGSSNPSCPAAKEPAPILSLQWHQNYIILKYSCCSSSAIQVANSIA